MSEIPDKIDIGVTPDKQIVATFSVTKGLFKHCDSDSHILDPNFDSHIGDPGFEGMVPTVKPRMCAIRFMFRRAIIHLRE